VVLLERAGAASCSDARRTSHITSAWLEYDLVVVVLSLMRARLAAN
jgi:hypothetical protein